MLRRRKAAEKEKRRQEYQAQLKIKQDQISTQSNDQIQENLVTNKADTGSKSSKQSVFLVCTSVGVLHCLSSSVNLHGLYELYALKLISINSL